MLEAHNLTFGYKQDKLILDKMNIAISPGERVALQAPSGFGKSTLCRLLAGFEKPLLGSIMVDGSPLSMSGVSPVQLIMQHPEKAVDPRLRMRDILAEAGEVSPKVIEGLGIQSRWMSRYSHELSGGELQRFCIARALTTNPKYIIADEISTMLDAVTQAQIWTFLVSEVQACDMGMVFVSHSPALTRRLATRVVELTHG